MNCWGSGPGSPPGSARRTQVALPARVDAGSLDWQVIQTTCLALPSTDLRDHCDLASLIAGETTKFRKERVEEYFT